MREASLEQPPGQPLRAGCCRALADPDRDDARRQQEYITAVDVLEVGLVEPLGPGEPRVVPVDDGRQVGFSPSAGQIPGWSPPS